MLSKDEHKQYQYVANAGNYMIGIYEGLDEKKNVKSTFHVINNLEAAQKIKELEKAELKKSKPCLTNLKSRLLDKQITKNGIEYNLKTKIKVGSTVLFYTNEADEVWNLPQNEIKDRLYVCTGLSTSRIRNKYEYGVLMFKHIDECRSSTNLKEVSGAWHYAHEQPGLRKMFHTQFQGLVLNDDFTIDSATHKLAQMTEESFG